LQGHRVLLINADSAVRRPRSPRPNRKVVELHGVHLSKFWNDTIREIYLSSDLPHRFDLIQTVMNQYPPALTKFEKHIQKWKRGKVGDSDLVFSKYEIGDQCYVVAIHTMKTIVDAHVWHERARNIAGNLAQAMGVTDCAVFLYIRRSPSETFDGVSFFRMGRRS
jgi:hypothetical protein